LTKRELLPKPLADYAATCLRVHSGRKKGIWRSLKRESRDRHLARIICAVGQEFGLEPTRNRASDDRDCACSIVATAIEKSESLVTKIWEARSSERDLVPVLINTSFFFSIQRLREMEQRLDQVLAEFRPRS
jgi:hypothetical protein